MRVIVSGSRDWVDSDMIWNALDGVLDAHHSYDNVLVVVHGNAPGADSIANHWVIHRQRQDWNVEPEAHPAQWTRHGRRAGPLRNQEMVDAGADLVLAFIKDNSPGASHLVREARTAGIPVEEFHVTTEVDMTEETTPEEVTPPTLVERLIAVKREVGAVAKGDRNSAQGFNFRGIDAVVNAVAGPLMKHGIMSYPAKVISTKRGTATTSKGSVMNTVEVVMQYAFTDGKNTLYFEAPGEAFDSGDKGTPKAMSVAYRTALLQALTLPTDEPDPDSESYEAVPQVAQMTDRQLLAVIQAETSVDDLKALWPAQGLAARSNELQAAIKKRVAELQEPSA